MSRTVKTATALCGVAVMLALGAASAQAQATRTWVSGVGDDVNPCSRTAPCKTFAGAIGKTAAGGEINAIDPGGYGAVTITKAITIDGAGTQASVLASGTNAININANPTDDVTLRNLSINGAGSPAADPNCAWTGLNGLRVIRARAVSVENVRIDHFTQTGIDVAPTASPVKVLLDGVGIHHGCQSGIRIAPGAGIAADVTMRNTTIANSGTGVSVGDGGYAGLVGSMVSYDTLGLGAIGTGTIEDLGGNTLTNNTTDGSFTKTPPPAATVTVTTPAPPPVTNTVTVTRVVCAVPDVRGLTLTAARRALTTGHCTAGKVTKRATKKRSQVGRVLTQSVKAGTQTGEGKAVALVVGRKA